MAQLQTTFSFWRTTPNLFISTLWSSLHSLFTFISAFAGWERYQKIEFKIPIAIKVGIWSVAVSFERMWRDMILLKRKKKSS